MDQTIRKPTKSISAAVLRISDIRGIQILESINELGDNFCGTPKPLLGVKNRKIRKANRGYRKGV